MHVQPRSAEPLRRHMASLLLIVGLLTLWLAKDILVPLVLAGLLALLLSPAVSWLERRRWPPWLAVTSILASVSLAVLLVGTLVISQVDEIVRDLPVHQGNLQRRLEALQHHGRPVAAAAAVVEDLHRRLSEGHAGPRLAPLQVQMAEAGAIAAASSWLKPVASTLLVCLLASFLIAQRGDLARRCRRLGSWLEARGGNPLGADAVGEIADAITSYVLRQTLVNISAGLVVFLGLLILGVPQAALWGLLTTLLRFVPIAGFLLALGVATLHATAVSPDWSLPLQVLFLFAVVELLLVSVIEPWWFAQGTGLTSLAIILAALFWTWLWGAAGLFLSVPLTVCLAVMGRRIEPLGYLTILLERSPPSGSEKPVCGHR